MRNTMTLGVCLLALAAAGRSQNITGSMAGRVVDQQGAAVPNAVVTATEPTRKVVIQTRTTTGGDFSIAGLPPGSYALTVEGAGFKKLSRTGIALDANDKLALGDLALEVGAVTESIEVSAQATLLQTQSAERSATITGKQVENIEVNGRNALDMAKLAPGVAFNTGASYAVGNSGTGARCYWRMAIGQRSSTSGWRSGHAHGGNCANLRTEADRAARQRLSRQEAIAEITRRLVEFFQPERIYLFGSAARGDDGPDSDLDFLIVVPDDIAAEKMRPGAARAAVRGTGHAKDIVPWPRTDFDRRAAWVKASLPATVLREGTLLYDAR